MLILKKKKKDINRAELVLPLIEAGVRRHVGDRTPPGRDVADRRLCTTTMYTRIGFPLTRHCHRPTHLCQTLHP